MKHVCKCKGINLAKKCISINTGEMNTIEAETLITALLETFFLNLGTKIKYPLPYAATKDWYLAHSNKEKKKISSKILKIIEDESKKYKG